MIPSVLILVVVRAEKLETSLTVSRRFCEMQSQEVKSKMTSDTELFQLLPSQRIEVLAAAIGRTLMEVERLFLLDLPTFLEDARFSATNFFALNSGPVQLHFDGCLTHALDVWPSQLSIINLRDTLIPSQAEKLYRLSED